MKDLVYLCWYNCDNFQASSTNKTWGLTPGLAWPDFIVLFPVKYSKTGAEGRLVALNILILFVRNDGEYEQALDFSSEVMGK